MGMDGVTDLQALQWIAEILAMLIGSFLAVCFLGGLIAGPDKIEPIGGRRSVDVDDQDLFAVATGDEEYLAAHCTLGVEKPTRPVRRQRKPYNGSGWDAVDIAGNTGNDWNPPEYYERYHPELIKTKKPKNKKPKNKKPKNKKPKSNKPKTQKVEQNSELIQECIAALVSLGEKKSVAKSTTNNYFTNNPNTKSVEEFIAGVYVK